MKKMHLFFGVRGRKQDMDVFREDLANMWVPMKLNDGNGNIVEKAVKVLLQPIELYSVVFPEECLDTMLRTLHPENRIGIESAKPSPKRTIPLNMLRKFLKLKKIPEWELEGKRFPLERGNIFVTGIGIKEDYRNDLGNECL